MSLLVKEYEVIHKTTENGKQKIEKIEQQKKTWKETKEKELFSLRSEEEKMLNSDQGLSIAKYEEAQEKLLKNKENIQNFLNLKAQLEAFIINTKDKLTQCQEKGHSTNLTLTNLENELSTKAKKIAELEHSIKKLDDLVEGVDCPVCMGKIHKDNSKHIIKHSQEEIAKLILEKQRISNEIDSLSKDADVLSEDAARYKDNHKKGQDKLSQITNRISALESENTLLNKTPDPRLDVNKVAFNAQLDALRKNIIDKEKELNQENPYCKIKEEAEKELQEWQSNAGKLKDSIKSLEEDIPYCDFWIKAFGDQGIRRFVIDDMIPTLNARVNYWLQYLIDNKIHLKFNNQLEEEITSTVDSDDLFVYNALSGGEHQRIDLAISQAFAYLMILTSGTCPSLVSLDEVVAHVDRPGVHCIFSMINELARDRQVLVVTHDPDLLQMLQGFDSIVIERKNGYSRLVKDEINT